jgi:hypothetical protein
VVQFQLKRSVTGAFAWDWYWRESTHDGIYGFGSEAPFCSGDASHSRYLGNQGELEIRWAPAPHIIIAFNFAGFKPGSFFKTTAYNAGPIAANAGFTYRFERTIKFTRQETILMLPTKRLELPCEMRAPVPGVGLDQAARKPADAVASLNFAQFGSERISEAKTGCRRNAALPHDPMFGPMTIPSVAARYASGRFGAAEYRKPRPTLSRMKIEQSMPGSCASIRRATVARTSLSPAPARISFKESRMLPPERVCKRTDEV